MRLESILVAVAAQATSAGRPSAYVTDHDRCKVAPDSPRWPCEADWQALNQTINGRLIKPLPTASVCHANQPNYNPSICNAMVWTESETYANDPVGIINPNWQDGRCLPQPQYPCSDADIPAYVVNAISVGDVVAGVNFARDRSIRLVIKGSGHDYLGRSTAPNSLSIWTKHITGIDFQDTFQPRGCPECDMYAAVTLGAGESWGSIYAAAQERNLTFVGGTGDTIGLGGYLTGGGHSPFSAMYGRVADQVLEMNVVLPSGEAVIANEKMNTDVFWAMRGGGGATFGVMTSVTIKTFPDVPFASMSLQFGGSLNSEAYWDAVTFVVASAPRLQVSNIMAYSYIAPQYPYNGSVISAWLGAFQLPNGTVEELATATAFLNETLSSFATAGIQAFFNFTQYDSLYAWRDINRNIAPIGQNTQVGNRLLDAKALSDHAALKAAIKKATPIDGGVIGNLNLVAGPDCGTRSQRVVVIRSRLLGGERIGTESVSWPPFNETAKETQTNVLTNTYMEALRELARDTGSYLNEGDVNEPDFQSAYWDDNYARLLSIKKRLDPTDVFWCVVCVGSEGWEEIDGKLCRK